jgi:hypothetical protein
MPSRKRNLSASKSKSTDFASNSIESSKNPKVAYNLVWNGEHSIAQGTFKRLYNLVLHEDGIPFTPLKIS